MARVHARRQVVEYQMNAMFLAAIRDLMQDVIVQLEAEVRAWRHPLAIHQKLDRGIGHQRHMNSMSRRERRMRIAMPGDPGAGRQPRHHDAQEPASAHIVFSYDFIHHRQRRRLQQRPAGTLNHRDIRPAVTRQQQNGLGLGMNVMFQLPLRLHRPRTFIEREHLSRELGAIDGAQRSGGGVDEHGGYASVACRR